MVREEDKKPEITAEGELAPQLGSNKTTLAKGIFDMSRLSKINELDKIWVGYFLEVPKTRGGRFAKRFCLNYLDLSVSVDGWRTNKMIQMVAGAKGAPSVGELQKKPGLIQRNITDRGWKKRAEEEGKTIVE